MLPEILCFIWIIDCCFGGNTLNDIYKYPSRVNNIFGAAEGNEYALLHQIISYSSSNASAFAIPVDPANFTKIAELLLNHSKAECKSLNLSSNACYEDCIYYLDPLTLITNMSDKARIKQILGYYSFGGDSVGFYETGNPDMCKYMKGTYCYTPLMGAPTSLTGSGVLIEHGCCLPGTCIGQDALKVLKKNIYCYQGYSKIYKDYMYKGQGDIVNNCAPLKRDLLSFGPMTIMTIFGMFLLLVIIASSITQIKTQTTMANIHYSNFSNEFILPKNNNPQTMLQAYLYCFSVQNIWNYFVRRRPVNKSQFNFLDGIRVGSMSWVIYGHAFVFFMSTGVSNLPSLMPIVGSESYDYISNKWYMMIASYAFYSVDSFFWLSGFLGAFTIVKQVKTYGDNAIRLCYLWIPMTFVARILRIVPMMMFVTAIQWKILDQLPYGYHVMDRTSNSAACNKNWYKVLFFYANLENGESAMSCMGHLWYIQCDMQFFLVLPFLVLLFQWKKMVGLLTTLIPIFLSISKRIYFAIEYEFPANLIYPAAHPNPHSDKSFEYSYFKPIPRAAVYFIGVFAMFLILMLQEMKNKTGRQKFVISEITYFGLMYVSGMVLISLVFWPYTDVKDGPQQRWSIQSNQWYYTLSRPAWALGLSLMSFAFVFRNTLNNEKSSIIKTILSSEIWQPIGKLTYSMYLIHLIIFMWWIGDLPMPQYYTFWYVFFIFVGIWFITFVVAFILWFVVEQPMANIVGLFIKWLNDIGKTMNYNKMNENLNINEQEKNDILDSLLYMNYAEVTKTFDDNENAELSVEEEDAQVR